MIKTRIIALLILLAGIFVAYFVYSSEPGITIAHIPKVISTKSHAFHLGLDLKGGTHLVYRADVSKVADTDVRTAMDSVRDVIERRVNLFGVSEPLVQVQQASFTNQNENRITVDLPGVTDVSQAIKLIGETPLLEFKTENPNPPKDISTKPDANGVVTVSADTFANQYISTKLTGQYLKQARLAFNQTTHAPYIVLEFNPDGAKLFADMTKANVGKSIAIFLDGFPISTPTVQEAILDGTATITGSFTPAEAKTLVGRLNSGALPVPIELISTQTIGAALGASATHAGTRAAEIGFAFVALFLILWYRLPGLIAVLALGIYTSIILALFKLIPVTLTAAGIAGFIISIGMAVDANVLIFERIKEEVRRNKEDIGTAVRQGFARAWFAIRDSNASSFITACILYVFGTSLIKGFALTFGLGVLVALLSAITITRVFLFALNVKKTTKFTAFLFGSGFSNARAKNT